MARKTHRQPLHLFALWYVIGLGILVYIVYATLAPHPALMFSSWSDKFYHFAGYFILTAWYTQLYKISRYRHLLVLLFVCLGILLECAQLFVNERSFELLDMVANAAGVCSAWLLMRGRLSSMLLQVEQKLLRAR